MSSCSKEWKLCTATQNEIVEHEVENALNLVRFVDKS